MIIRKPALWFACTLGFCMTRNLANAQAAGVPVADHSVLMILHEAVSARGVRMLAESMKAAAPAAVDAE